MNRRVCGDVYDNVYDNDHDNDNVYDNAGDDVYDSVSIVEWFKGTLRPLPDKQDPEVGQVTSSRVGLKIKDAAPWRRKTARTTWILLVFGSRRVG